MKCERILFIVFPVLFFLMSFLFAQGPDTLWTKTYGGINYDVGCSVQQTSDGGYIITGITVSFGAGGGDVYLIKTDSLGDTLWTRTYGGAADDIGFSVGQTTDGGYIIAGYTRSFGAGDSDVYLIKTDSLGDTLWTKTYGGTSWDAGNSVQQTFDTGYIIAGYTASFGAGDDDVYLIKTDLNGDTLWTKTYGGTYLDVGYSVQETSDGGYVIAGRKQPIDTLWCDVYLIKTDSLGSILWTKTYGDTGSDGGYSVQQTFDTGYIIAGETNSFGAGDFDVYLIKTNSIGDTLWTRTYGGTSWEVGNSVQQTFDTGYIIAGETNSFGVGSEDVWLVKTDSLGDTLWTKTLGGINSDCALLIQQIYDEGYIIAGYTNSFGAGDFDVYLIKTEPDVGIEEDEITKPNPPLSNIKVFPNPFMNTLKIEGYSTAKIYDISGRFIVEVKDEWDGRNTEGKDVKAGIYFLKAEGVNVGKVIKLR